MRRKIVETMLVPPKPYCYESRRHCCDPLKIPRLILPNLTSWPAALFPQERLRYWIGTIGRFGTVQFGAQAVMALCGLLIVRTLSKKEYALFLVANTMQGTMNILADAGATIGLTTLGGKVWQDRYRLGQVVNSTLAIRRKMMAISMLCILPILVTLLRRNGATLAYSALITTATLASLYFIVGANVSRIVLQLHSRFVRLQQIDLAAPLARLGCIAVASIMFLNAAVAIVAMTAIWAVQWWQMSKWTVKDADPEAPINLDDSKFIRAQVHQVLPSSVFFCLQSQIYIFILSLYGKSDRLADVGALGRLAVFFSVVMTVMHSLVVPAFARCQQMTVLRWRYIQILLGFILLATMLVTVSAIFPDPLLWLLGGRYANLRHELVLSIAVTVVSGLADAMWILNGAKGWTKHSWIGIPLQLILQVGLLFYLDVQTVRGVLTFTLWSFLPPIIVSSWLAWRELFN